MAAKRKGYMTRAVLARAVHEAGELMNRKLELDSPEPPLHRVIEVRKGRRAPLTESMEGRFIMLWLSGFMSAATGNGRIRK